MATGPEHLDDIPLALTHPLKIYGYLSDTHTIVGGSLCHVSYPRTGYHGLGRCASLVHTGSTHMPLLNECRLPACTSKG